MKTIGAFTFLLLASVSLASSAKADIEELLRFIGYLEGATFIRNGSSHPAIQAVSHLRLKWQKQAKRISSAEEFIALCGSKSSMSGARYRIRFSDGSERFCDEVLTEHLLAFRQKANKAPEPTP